MDLYNVLSKIEIKYEETEHHPVFTIGEAQSVKSKIKGIGCKNLFLTDKKTNTYLLVVLEESKQANLREIANTMGMSHLSFVQSDELYQILHLQKGSVSPFGIIYDKKNCVTLLLDSELQGKKLLLHPNTNTKTMSIWYDDLIKFIKYTNHSYFII